MTFRTRYRSFGLWRIITIIGIIGSLMSDRPLYALENQEALRALIRDDLKAVIAQDPALARNQDLDGGMKLVVGPLGFSGASQNQKTMQMAILLQPVLPETHPAFIRIHLPIFYQLDMTHQAHIVSRPTLALIQQALRDAETAQPARGIAVQKLKELPRFQAWKDRGWSYTTDVYLFGSFPSVKDGQVIVVFDTPLVTDQDITLTIDVKTKKIISVFEGQA